MFSIPVASSALHASYVSYSCLQTSDGPGTASSLQLLSSRSRFCWQSDGRLNAYHTSLLTTPAEGQPCEQWERQFSMPPQHLAMSVKKRCGYSIRGPGRSALRNSGVVTGAWSSGVEVRASTGMRRVRSRPNVDVRPLGPRAHRQYAMCSGHLPPTYTYNVRWSTGEAPGAPSHITAVKVSARCKGNYLSAGASPGEVWGWELSLMGDDRGDGAGVPADAALKAVLASLNSFQAKVWKAMSAVRRSVKEAMQVTHGSEMQSSNEASMQQRRAFKVRAGHACRAPIQPCNTSQRRLPG